MDKTLNSLYSDTYLCKVNGWRQGTKLAGDEGYGITVIEITAIGQCSILAKQISHNGIPEKGFETPWTLTCREWQEVEK